MVEFVRAKIKQTIEKPSYQKVTSQRSEYTLKMAQNKLTWGGKNEDIWKGAAKTTQKVWDQELDNVKQELKSEKNQSTKRKASRKDSPPRKRAVKGKGKAPADTEDGSDEDDDSDDDQVQGEAAVAVERAAAELRVEEVGIVATTVLTIASPMAMMAMIRKRSSASALQKDMTNTEHEITN
ncbi:hypothetical protein BGZ65_003244, partial [Modicella reniformis]